MVSIANVSSTDPRDWYLFYDSLDEIIRSVRPPSNPPGFVAFLSQAKSYLPLLPASTKDLLFVHLKHLLVPAVLRRGRVMRVIRTINLIHRTHFPATYANNIFSVIRPYMSQLGQGFLTSQQQDKLLWQLVVAFTSQFPDESPLVFQWVQMMHHLAMACYVDKGPFWWRFFLHTWSRIRSQYAKPIRQEVDASAIEYMHALLNRLKRDQEVKETFYMEFIQFLNTTELVPFDGLYTEVIEDKICSYREQIQMPSPNVRVLVWSQEQLSQYWQQAMTFSVVDTYHQMETLKSALSLGPRLTQGRFRVMLFENKTMFDHFMPLWKLRSDNGGITIRMNNSYHSFVYKEGTVVRNLGHELAHAFFMTWAGDEAHEHLPVWLLEGSAETLGNQSCDGFHNRQHTLKAWTPSISWITQLDAMQPDVYHWGALLFRYLYNNHPLTLRSLLLDAIQRHTSKRNFNTEVMHLQSDLFPFFILKEQTRCYKLYTSQFKRDESARYQQYLQQSGHRLALLRTYLEERANKNVTAAPIRGFDGFDFSEVDVNSPFENNNTLLHIAANHSDWVAVWWLLMKGADQRRENNQQKTALDIYPPQMHHLSQSFQDFLEKRPDYTPARFRPFEERQPLLFISPSLPTHQVVTATPTRQVIIHAVQPPDIAETWFTDVGNPTSEVPTVSSIATPPLVSETIWMPESTPLPDVITESMIMKNVSRLLDEEARASHTPEWILVSTLVTKNTPSETTTLSEDNRLIDTRVSTWWFMLVGPFFMLLIFVICWRRRPKLIQCQSNRPRSVKLTSYSPVTQHN